MIMKAEAMLSKPESRFRGQGWLPHRSPALELYLEER